MSKSKRNTVDPEAIITRFGADTARWFILADNPPERDMEWTEAGVVGAYRFTQRLYRLVEALPDIAGADQQAPDSFSAAARRLRRATHRTIAAVTEALETFAFNSAVARIHELANALSDAEKADAAGGEHGLSWARSEGLNAIARLIAPMMPHLAEEIHARLSPAAAQLVAEQAWPASDPALAAAELITVAVQVMGKLRGTIEVPPGADEATVLAAAAGEPNVARALSGKRIVKRVYVPNRIVNFVLAG
jgi:leucyl-tRNA synthetase